MAIYGIDYYGTSAYGVSPLPNYRAEPFVVQPTDYGSITITWTPPTGTIYAWRLIKNMYGPPVDQDDGAILVDSATGYPGNSYIDTSAVQGKYHYYSFFVQTSQASNIWVKSAIGGCLAVKNHGSSNWIRNLLPGFFSAANNATSAQLKDPVAFENMFINKFTRIVGWGLDYIKTQYDTYTNTNNPWTIPPPDLLNLSAQLGMNINPDIHLYTLRKAVYYNASVNKERGTLPGITTELSSLTGWNADIQLSNNFMLENDQSDFLDPVYLPWSQYIAYNIGESVQYGAYWYQCTATGNIGNAPSGTTSSNTWWSPVLNTNSSAYLTNSATGGFNTWELIYPAGSVSGNGTPPASSMFETLGVVDPISMPASQTLNTNPDFSLGSFAGWAAFQCSSSITNTVTYNQPYTVMITADGTHAGTVQESAATFPVSQTGKYNVFSWVYYPAGGFVSVGVNWNTSAQAYISTTSNTINVPANTWVLVSSLGMTPPLTAAYAYPFVGFGSTPVAGTLLYAQSVRAYSDTPVAHNNAFNSLQGINLSGNTNNIWLRSVSRTTTDKTSINIIAQLNSNSTFETGTSPWTANSCTIAQSNTFAHSGSFSMLMTPNTSGAAAQCYTRTESITVQPNGLYNITAWLYSPLGYTSVQVAIDWYDLTSTYISTTASGFVSIAAGVWTRFSFTAYAPSNAYYAQAGPTEGSNPPNGATLYIDDATFGLTSFSPNRDQAVGDGIPVPFAMPSQNWSPSIRYGTGNVVLYNNQSFMAQRASTNMTPLLTPTTIETDEWLPVSMDQRYAICVSGFISGSTATSVTPFVEWYDAGGNFISRVFSRNSPLPTNFAYDSFTYGTGNFLNGRTTDDGSTQWSNNTGSYQLSPYGNGCIYPSVIGQRTYGTISANSANCQVGLTFVTNPQAGQSQGLILRYQNDNNYIRADQTALRLKSGGVWSVLGTYSTAFSTGDRMTITLTGSSITVYRNGVSVLSATSSFNTTGTVMGIICENT